MAEHFVVQLLLPRELESVGQEGQQDAELGIVEAHRWGQREGCWGSIAAVAAAAAVAVAARASSRPRDRCGVFRQLLHEGALEADQFEFEPQSGEACAIVGVRVLGKSCTHTRVADTALVLRRALLHQK